MKMVLSLLVNNESGVASRISGLFTRRGFNIEDITGGVTSNPEISRITVVFEGDEDIKDQVINQLSKLEDVIKIEELRRDNSVCRELILVRVGVNEIQRPEVIIELTGNKSKLDAFLELLTGYEILEIARTGLTGLRRGNKRNLD